MAELTKHRATPDPAAVKAILESLVEVGHEFYRRGWVLGTSGNFSARTTDSPLRLMITMSGLDKGALSDSSFLEIDDHAQVLSGFGRPSAETALHLKIVQRAGAGAVLHTHSIWSTILSDRFAASGGLSIQGYEMLKGLSGVSTHEHREWLPILENTQDYALLAQQMENLLAQNPEIHGILLRKHGLYTWGQDVAEAKRHVEILEFLLETVGRGLPSGISE